MMRLRGRSVAASPALALRVLEGGVMGLAQDALVGLAGGAHVDCLWGQAQADVGCCMAALCPRQCHGYGFMEGTECCCGCGGWCGGAHTTASSCCGKA